MNRNAEQTAERNFAGIIRLRRILPDCVLFLIPLLILPLFLKYSLFSEAPEEYSRLSPASVQHLAVPDTGSAVLPLPDYLTGTFRMPELWLSDDRPRFCLGRLDSPAILNPESSVLTLMHTNICIKDRVLTNCRKFLKFSLHVRAGPAAFPVFREFNPGLT